MLTFISFWRAAAIVLNDMGSSAFYAGAIAEHFNGNTGLWFILAIMLLAYAVRSVYIESCSMFVRGGVYRVVEGGHELDHSKFSVSALMFDYILTGPISGVSAGLYLVGLLNELLQYFHMHTTLPVNGTAAFFAVLVTIYFWWENIKGIPESSEKALRIMYVTTVMVVVMLGWCGYTLWVRGVHLPPFPFPRNLTFSPDALGWLRHTNLPYTVGLIGILIGLGHSVLAMSGEETMAQVYREMEHPKLRNLEKAGFVIFVYSLIFTAGVAFFAVMIIPDQVRQSYFDNPIGGLAMWIWSGRSRLAAGLPGLRRDRRRSDACRRRQYRNRGFEWRPEPRLRGRNSSRLVPAPASPLWNVVPDPESGRRVATRHHHPESGKHFHTGRSVRVRRDVELCDEGPGGIGFALQGTWAARIPEIPLNLKIGSLLEIPGWGWP